MRNLIAGVIIEERVTGSEAAAEPEPGQSRWAGEQAGADDRHTPPALPCPVVMSSVACKGLALLKEHD